MVNFWNANVSSSKATQGSWGSGEGACDLGVCLTLGFKALATLLVFYSLPCGPVLSCNFATEQLTRKKKATKLILRESEENASRESESRQSFFSLCDYFRNLWKSGIKR